MAPDWRWPTCFLYTGLVTTEMEIHLADIIKIHRMYLSIMMAFQEEAKRGHRGGGGGGGGEDDQPPPPPPNVPLPTFQVRRRLRQKTTLEQAKQTGHIKLRRLRTKTRWPPQKKEIEKPQDITGATTTITTADEEDQSKDQEATTTRPHSLAH